MLFYSFLEVYDFREALPFTQVGTLQQGLCNQTGHGSNNSTHFSPGPHFIVEHLTGHQSKGGGGQTKSKIDGEVRFWQRHNGHHF